MRDEDRLRAYVARSMRRAAGAFPTVRKAARVLRWSQARVVTTAECCKDEGGFDILVGFGVFGAGAGTAEFDTEGDYQLEVYAQ